MDLGVFSAAIANVNASESPVTIEKGQVLGRAEMIRGMIVNDTGLSLDYTDMQRPGTSTTPKEQPASRPPEW